MPQERRDEAHRAIGRFVVEFSALVATMREAVEHQLDAGEPTVARLALGEANASQITNAFFAICEHLLDLDDEEKRVASRLKKEVTDTLKERNDIAHGDWVLADDSWSRKLPGPTLHRTKPGRKAGAWLEQVRSFEELDGLSDEVSKLTETIGEFAWLCMGIHPLAKQLGTEVRVRDVFRFSKKQVRRKGRYADLAWDDPASSIEVF